MRAGAPLSPSPSPSPSCNPFRFAGRPICCSRGPFSRPRPVTQLSRAPGPSQAQLSELSAGLPSCVTGHRLRAESRIGLGPRRDFNHNIRLRNSRTWKVEQSRLAAGKALNLVQGCASKLAPTGNYFWMKRSRSTRERIGKRVLAAIVVLGGLLGRNVRYFHRSY